MAQGRELFEVAFLAVGSRQSRSDPRKKRRTGSEVGLQCGVHLREGGVGLLEETVDYAPAELPLVFVVVHLQDLLERDLIDAVTEVQKSGRAFLTLQIRCVSPSVH